jgi:hypothetical protein
MRTGLLTAAAFAAIAFSGAAQASVVTETFTGFINSGIDNIGAFGAVGANLAGDTVAFSFSYDTGLLEADVNAGTDGSYFSLTSPFAEYHDYAGDSALTESVTINSQTFTIANSSSNPPANLGLVQGCMAEGSCGGVDGSITTMAQLGSNTYIETNVDTTQNYSLGDNLLSQTEVNALFGGGATTGSISISDGAAGDGLYISNVNAESSATPEPTTWISLALGLGMVGLLKRRRSAR